MISACVLLDGGGDIIFTTLQNPQSRSLFNIQLHAQPLNACYLGKMTRTGLLGLTFEVYDHQSLHLATVAFAPSPFHRGPISFSLTTFGSPFVEDLCRHSERDRGERTYSSYNKHADEVVFKTKAPTYNTEIKSWLHNLGARVKMASNNNFVLVRDMSQCDEITEALLEMSDTAIFRGVDKIVIRHGKDSMNSWVLDYRDVAPIVALATMLAVLSDKEPWVTTD